jgi:hypothetical protein
MVEEKAKFVIVSLFRARMLFSASLALALQAGDILLLKLPDSEKAS